VLSLGAIVLRTSKDHEAAVRVKEGVPVLGRHSLLLGHLLVAVPTLALARLTQHALEKFVVLKLMLDGVVVVGARLLQELLEVVVVALPPARSVGRCDHVGVRVTPVPPLPLILHRGRALVLPHTLGLSHGPTISEDCPDRLLAGGVVHGNVQELTGGARLSTAELMDEGLAGGPGEEHADDVCINHVG
jgi:hypothetical protein